MFVGISKNLGNGFKVGIGTNLSEKKKTQRELSKEEDAVFVSKCKERITLALLGFFHSHGVCIASQDLDDGIKLPEFRDVFHGIEPISSRFGKRLALYEGTGKITQSGKEEMLEGVMDIENYLRSKQSTFDMSLTLNIWHRGRPANCYALNAIKVLVYPLSIILIVAAFAAKSKLTEIQIAALISVLLSIYTHFASRKYKIYLTESSEALKTIAQQISKPEKVLREFKR